MCTAITFSCRNLYFGRTLDLERTYGEEVVISPRKFSFSFLEKPAIEYHNAIIGMAHVSDGYPLYYDAVNEAGLCMAGLNFPGFAQYGNSIPGKDNIASFEFIPWVLGQCENISDTRKLLLQLQLINKPFSTNLPPTPLHWIIADRAECITVEAMADGIHVHENPVGVLTNNPPFDNQMLQLCNYMHLSPSPPENHFSKDFELKPYSRGMGAIGLPGDLSSQSRFVRAVFTKLNSLCEEDESVSQFFHILDSVSQARGSCRLADGSCVATQYASCCDASQGIYYYTTYSNRRICAVELHKANLEINRLLRFPLETEQDILFLNQGSMLPNRQE